MININLENKVAFVSGGSRGIGAAIVKKLAECGATVAFGYRQNDKAATEVRQTNDDGRIYSYKFDISDFAKTKTVITGVKKEFGSIDILVNNAGMNKDAFFGMMGEATWSSVINTNLNGLYNVTKNVITKMVSQKNGVIINLSSIAGIMGTAGQVNYSTTKAGIIGFTKALARECGKYNIRVTCVSPGFIETDMYTRIPADRKSGVLDNIPLNRIGKPGEVAALVAFLASDLATYITGQNFIIDGGLS